MSKGTRIVHLCNNSVRDYLARIQSGITRAATSSSFSAALENTLDSPRDLNAILADESIAGLILSPPLCDDRHALLAIEDARIPYVRIAPMLDPERASSVVMDEYDAARAVTEVMLAKGHRRVAILRGPSTHLVSMRRYNGYAAALGGKGMRVDQSLVAQGDFTRESGRQQAAKLFAARPTAIFSSNDEMALGILDAAAKAGIAIPGSISLVGFDDNPGAKLCRPALTTVRQPLEEMGASAARLLLDLIRNPGKRRETVTEPYQVVERNSVAACQEDRAA